MATQTTSPMEQFKEHFYATKAALEKSAPSDEVLRHWETLLNVAMSLREAPREDVERVFAGLVYLIELSKRTDRGAKLLKNSVFMDFCGAWKQHLIPPYDKGDRLSEVGEAVENNPECGLSILEHGFDAVSAYNRLYLRLG